MALVTLSASYGAGGSRVGPAVAERLGVPFVDRIIPTQVAERLAVPLEDAHRRDESVSGLLDRLLMSLVPLAQVYGGAAPEPMPVGDHAFREATEQVLRERAAGGRAVILGRAAALVLRDDPRALHVRLDGPPAARVRQAMRVEGIERDVAERRQAETDRARNAYVRDLYGGDPRDPGLYHLVIDSTAVGVDACVDLVVLAAQAHHAALDEAG
jgi:cytidylate kinase